MNIESVPTVSIYRVDFCMAVIISGLSLLRVGLQGESSLRCSTLERIGSDSNLGLRVTGGLTFGPEPGAIDKG